MCSSPSASSGVDPSLFRMQLISSLDTCRGATRMCALLIFNKTKDSSAVRQKMHESMLAKAEYRKTINHDANGDSRYVFVKESDPGREIQVHAMLFDIPGDIATPE